MKSIMIACKIREKSLDSLNIGNPTYINSRGRRVVVSSLFSDGISFSWDIIQMVMDKELRRIQSKLFLDSY